jgi:hypothetical protein
MALERVDKTDGGWAEEKQAEGFKYGMAATICHLGGVATNYTWHFCPVNALCINDRCAIYKFTNENSTAMSALF